MTGCHKCPHAPLIEAHAYDGVDWEQTPCSKCPQVNEDAASAQTRDFDDDRASVRWPPPEEVAEPAVLPFSVLVEALKGFLEIAPRTFRIVQRRYQGDTYALIAEELEVTPQAVEIQLRRALETHPHLKSLLPGKAKRQAARKRKRLVMARRGKPGAGDV